MTEKLGNDQVRHIARLSRLELTDREIEDFAGQLSEVLQYVSKLSELVVDDVEPMAHAVDITNVLRSDDQTSDLAVDRVLENAADQSPPFFKVPKVLDDGAGA